MTMPTERALTIYTHCICNLQLRNSAEASGSSIKEDRLNLIQQGD